MGFVRIFWKNNVQEAYLPKVSISGQIVSEMFAGYTQKTPYKPFWFFFESTQKKFGRVCMEFSKHNWATISETISRPQDAHFWQVGLMDIVLSEYSDKSHNFRNFIFVTSHFSTVLVRLQRVQHAHDEQRPKCFNSWG